MLMKLDSVIFATAFAIKVLPVPGGPCNKIPFGAWTSTYSKASLCLMGHSIASRNSSLRDSNPPTSSHVTLGVCTITSRNAEGLTSFNESRKSSFVIIIFCNIF